MMLEKGGYGEDTPKMTERCKPDYETVIVRLKAKAAKTVMFRDAALSYFEGTTASDKMAELIGELVTKAAALERELASLIERQEQDK